MAKLKDHILREEEHRRIVQANIERHLALDQLVKRSLAKVKHQWAEDMPDLEGKALADAERQFDYDAWLGEHGIGEGTVQDEVNPYLFDSAMHRSKWQEPVTLNVIRRLRNNSNHQEEE